MKTLKRGSFAKWGAEGGSAKTKAKTQAARRNGKKGGRPPKLRPWMAYYGGSYHYELMSKDDIIQALREIAKLKAWS